MLPTHKSKNPLANFMRQPKIYIELPSGGNFWPVNSIQLTETMQFPVYSMTAKDELAFKTPDALLNGQAMVDVIQSCFPNIRNAWDMPVIDLNAVMIAIRLATYGEKMTIKHKIPVINEEVEYELDLRILLDQQRNGNWLDQVAVSPELVVYVKPLTFKHMTQTSLKSFETSRIMNMVNDDTLSDEKKMEMFNASFNNLTRLTIDLMAESIIKVATEDGEVSDKRHILEFVNNIDKELFDIINSHLAELKKLTDFAPIEFSTTEEQQADGAPATYSIPITFNESDFFG